MEGGGGGGYYKMSPNFTTIIHSWSNRFLMKKVSYFPTYLILSVLLLYSDVTRHCSLGLIQFFHLWEIFLVDFLKDDSA